MDLGRQQKEVALTLGVTESTVTGWELNRTIPGITHLPKIISFLGYVPEPYCKQTDNISEQMKHYRQIHGLTQGKFAKLVRVDVTTIAKWERGDHKPMKLLREKTVNLLKF
jgi:DNA-binding transcriptional regulator YiaG